MGALIKHRASLGMNAFDRTIAKRTQQCTYGGFPSLDANKKPENTTNE